MKMIERRRVPHLSLSCNILILFFSIHCQRRANDPKNRKNLAVAQKKFYLRCGTRCNVLQQCVAMFCSCATCCSVAAYLDQPQSVSTIQSAGDEQEQRRALT